MQMVPVRTSANIAGPDFMAVASAFGKPADRHHRGRPSPGRQVPARRAELVGEDDHGGEGRDQAGGRAAATGGPDRVKPEAVDFPDPDLSPGVDEAKVAAGIKATLADMRARNWEPASARLRQICCCSSASSTRFARARRPPRSPSTSSRSTRPMRQPGGSICRLTEPDRRVQAPETLEFCPGCSKRVVTGWDARSSQSLAIVRPVPLGWRVPRRFRRPGRCSASPPADSAGAVDGPGTRRADAVGGAKSRRL